MKLLDQLSNTLDSEIEESIHGIALKGKTIQEVINELSSKMKVVKLETLGEIIKGKGIAKSDLANSGIPCVRYGELYTRHHRIIRNYFSYISQETCRMSVKLEKNDILFAGSGETITEIGKSAIRDLWFDKTRLIRRYRYWLWLSS